MMRRHVSANDFSTRVPRPLHGGKTVFHQEVPAKLGVCGQEGEAGSLTTPCTKINYLLLKALNVSYKTHRRKQGKGFMALDLAMTS